MKNNIKSLLMGTAVIFSMGLGFTACQDDAIDPLENIYKAPDACVVTSASVTDKTKEGNIRTYTIEYSTSTGQTLKLVQLTNQYYLLGTGYIGAEAGAAKNGNFVKGLSTVNGSPIEDGTFTMVKNGDDYTVKGVLFTADGNSVKLSGSVVLPFEPDDPTALTQLKSATANPDGTVTVVFSTGGYTETLNMTTYQMEYAGEGNDLQIIFNCPDGKLHEGVYSPGTGYVAGYTFMNDAYTMWGIPAFEDYAGSLWYTIANGAKVPSLVKTGDIKVTKSGSNYTILLDQGKGGIYAQYQGKLADVDPDGAVAAQALTYGGGANWVAYGGNTIALGFAAPGASIRFEASMFSFVAEGNGIAFNVEFFSTDGTLAPGTYTAADNGAVGEGNWLKGYDNGWGGFGGSVLHKLTDGADAAEALAEGTFVVTKDGDNYKITTSIAGVEYEYNGPIVL